MVKQRLRKMGEVLISQGLISKKQLKQATDEVESSGIGLGAALVKLGFITWEGLSAILGEQIQIIQNRRIGEVLIEQGLITERQLQAGLEEQKQSGKKVGECLVELGFISEYKLINVLSAQLDIQHVMLENFAFSEKLLTILPRDIVSEYRVIPLYETNGVITMAMADPTNQRIIDHLKVKTGKMIEPVIASERSILSAINRNYVSPPDEEGEFSEKTSHPDGIFVVTKVDRGIKAPVEQGSPVVETITNVILQAIKEEASAVHIEPVDHCCQLRYRIDGSLVEQKPILQQMYEPIVSYLKTLTLMSNVKNFPMEGFFQFPCEGRKYDIHLSIFPIITDNKNVSEKIVLRITNQERSVLPFDQLGFLPNTLNLFNELITQPEGVILLTGPENSGISSTLYTVLQYLNTYYSGKKNIMSVEKSIKNKLKGVVQSQVNPEAGFKFASGIRSILQQDPDIIMVSDIDSVETCKMIVMAALAGHLVFSTLHTRDSVGVYPHLFSMGIEPYLLVSTIRGILAQRIVKKICEHCKEEYEADPSMLQKLGMKTGIHVFRGRGCVHCKNTGFQGRVGIFELLKPDKDIESLLERRSSYDDIKKYCLEKEGFDTLWHDGLRKILMGVTTIEQVLGVL